MLYLTVHAVRREVAMILSVREYSYWSEYWLPGAIVSGLFALIFLSGNLMAAEKLVLNCGNSNPYITADGGGFYGLVVQEVFRRLGLEAETVRLPSERALLNANDGIEDGNIARIKGLEKKYPNLMRVPEKVIDFEFVAYSKDSNIPVTGWTSFKSYDVGFITGWKILEKNVTHTKSLTKVKNPRQLFALLVKDRADIIIFERWGGLWWNKELNADAHLIMPPVEKREMFMYLHKKHAVLVAEVARALAGMKKDGAYQRIFDKTLGILNK